MADDLKSPLYITSTDTSSIEIRRIYRSTSIVDDLTLEIDAQEHWTKLHYHSDGSDTRCRKCVFELHCVFCMSFLSRRGMRASLIANNKISLYSTDACTENVLRIGKHYATGSCDCIIQETGCGLCGNVLGYHVAQPCKVCLDSPHNGHLWLFLAKCIYPIHRFSHQRLVTWEILGTPKTEMLEDLKYSNR